MSKFSLPVLAMLVLLTACSAAARTQADAQLTEAPAASEFVGAAAITLAADAATAEGPMHRAATHTAISCDVRAQRTPNGVLIHARAVADHDINADYDLRIVKSGGGNSSEISQSGEFSLTAGNSSLLGESEISFEQGSRVRAYLTIRDASGVVCERSFRL